MAMPADQDPSRRRSGAATGKRSENTMTSRLVNDGTSGTTSFATRAEKVHLAESDESVAQSNANSSSAPHFPPSQTEDTLSPAAADIVFPIRSMVSIESNAMPPTAQNRQYDSCFPRVASARGLFQAFPDPSRHAPAGRCGSKRYAEIPLETNLFQRSHHSSTSGGAEHRLNSPMSLSHRQPPDVLTAMLMGRNDDDASIDGSSAMPSECDGFVRPTSRSSVRTDLGATGLLMAARFKHVVTEEGHAIITGRDGETLQRCEDEPIHIPGAVQGFGVIVALEEQQDSKLLVRVVSENSERLIGYTPKQLFALDSFLDVLSEEQADNLLFHVDFIRDEEADVLTNGPEVFIMSVRSPTRRSQKMWCAIHIDERNKNLVICEFELVDDQENPLAPASEFVPERPEDTLHNQPTEEELVESTHNISKPLRILRSARKRKAEDSAMEVFNVLSQVQEQFAAAPSLEELLKIVVGVTKELTGFHRVMIYQFDQAWNGRVVTELVDPLATKDLYKGLNFPASDIPKQARDLYKINKVRMLYDRDQETARLVCRTVEDLETPLDLTHSYLRAMSPIHVQYLANMAVRSSMSISISAFDELWGLISCHSYGSKGTRVSFPIRKMCRLVGDSASINIERLSYTSRLQARQLINTVPTKNNPSGYIVASSEELLKLFNADFGLLSIRDEKKILGQVDQSREVLAMLEYLRMRCITHVLTSQDIKEDFPDLRYAPGFRVIAGLLLVPLSTTGKDFIAFFRKGRSQEVKWAGNPYEKTTRKGTEGFLKPRKSFKTWSETISGKCRDWTEEELETAAVLCLVYGKFIGIWRQKEAALQNSQLKRLLMSNSAHEVRTPLNAIINYLEIALEGSLDKETRENLTKSHTASKSLIHVINDLLDLTKTEEGKELTKEDVFNLGDVLREATNMFTGDTQRKNIAYEVKVHPDLPSQVVGDSRGVKQSISNIVANAIENTTEGGVSVVMSLSSHRNGCVHIEVCISDTGIGMSSTKLNTLSREFEQVELGGHNPWESITTKDKSLSDSAKSKESGSLGLGLAMVARILHNMNGQLRLKSEEGKGSRFVIQFPFELPGSGPTEQLIQPYHISSTMGSAPSLREKLFDTSALSATKGELTLVEHRGSGRRPTESIRHDVSHKINEESLGSERSLQGPSSVRRNGSMSSAKSADSETDRFVEAIQKPHGVGGWLGPGDKDLSNKVAGARPKLVHKNTTCSVNKGNPPTSPRASSVKAAPISVHFTDNDLGGPGSAKVEGQSQLIRPIRVPDKCSKLALADGHQVASRVNGAVQDVTVNTDEPPSARHLRVLVAEDDPLNSRIIKKRLEKLGHEVHLTVNGEECAIVYGERLGYFEIVLMDMQMPIVDGLASAKMIRSFERAHPSYVLSERASLNDRVPIIAVSASLMEKDRDVYIDAGFDGWMSKPVSIDRLREIVTGMFSADERNKGLYQPGLWEHGGWFK